MICLSFLLVRLFFYNLRDWSYLTSSSCRLTNLLALVVLRHGCSSIVSDAMHSLILCLCHNARSALICCRIVGAAARRVFRHYTSHSSWTRRRPCQSYRLLANGSFFTTSESSCEHDSDDTFRYFAVNLFTGFPSGVVVVLSPRADKAVGFDMIGLFYSVAFSAVNGGLISALAFGLAFHRGEASPLFIAPLFKPRPPSSACRSSPSRLYRHHCSLRLPHELIPCEQPPRPCARWPPGQPSLSLRLCQPRPTPRNHSQFLPATEISIPFTVNVSRP
jgi:hypothetical protein